MRTLYRTIVTLSRAVLTFFLSMQAGNAPPATEIRFGLRLMRLNPGARAGGA